MCLRSSVVFCFNSLKSCPFVALRKSFNCESEFGKMSIEACRVTYARELCREALRRERSGTRFGISCNIGD